MKTEHPNNQWFSLGLIGYPLEQSLSPSLHFAALAAMGLQGEYNLYPLPPTGKGEAGIAELIQRIRRQEISGLNATIPHKQRVISHLDGLTPRAAAIGAVNTVYLDGSRVLGDNTDAPAFIQDLARVAGLDKNPNLVAEGGQVSAAALVLGGGGAARAVVYALWQAGWHVGLAARQLEQSSSIVSSFQQRHKSGQPSSNRLEAVPMLLPDLEKFLTRSEKGSLILINASSAGMAPNVQTSPWPKGLAFPMHAFAYDLVYEPLKTSFLQSASEAGLPVSNGLGMLIEQAALALERWTSRKVPREVMWRAVEHVLAKS